MMKKAGKVLSLGMHCRKPYDAILKSYVTGEPVVGVGVTVNAQIAVEQDLDI